MHLRSCIPAAAGLALLLACGGKPAPPPKPKPAPAPPTLETRLRELKTPPLPFELETASEDLRRGLQRGLRFLEAPLATPPEDADPAAFQRWMKDDLVQWLTHSAQELNRIQRALAPVAEGDDAEATVAAAVVALSWNRVHDHFIGLPPPPNADGEATRQAYRDGLEQAAVQWLQQAAGSFAFCARRAQRSEDPALAPWQRFCGERLDALAAQMQAVRTKLDEALEAQAEAARGPRPPGSQACWTPSRGRGPKRPVGQAQAPAPALVMLDSVEPSRVPLLAPERAAFLEALRKQLAARYADAEIQVEWLEEKRMAALRSQWQRGQQHSGGPRCSRRLELVEFLRASHPNLELATAWAACKEGACKLYVDLGGQGVSSVLGFRRLQAPLSAPLSEPSHWMEAVQTLEPVGQGDRAALMGALEGRFRAPGGEPITLHRFDLHGPWQDAAAREVVEAAPLADCPGAAAGFGRDLMGVLQVAPSGRVAALWQPPAQASARKQQRCVERALKQLRFGEGKPGRRIGLTLTLGHGQGQTARDAAYGAVDLATGVRVSVASDDNRTLSPAPLHDPATHSRLAACYARHVPDADATLELHAHVQVGPGGKPRKAAVTPLDASQVDADAALERCLAEALALARFDCTSDGKPARVEALVCMRRQAE